MKKFLAFVIVAMMALSCFSFAFAEGEASATSNMPTIGASVITNGDNGAGSFAADILKTVQYVGYAIAIGWFLYLGIKYVMASADEKASLKGGMIKMVIGIILIAGASTIIGWAVDAKLF